MVVHSPELIGDTTDVQQAAVESVQEPKALESLFYLLAGLECLGALARSPENFKPQIDEAIRNELRGAIKRLPLSQAVGLFLGFETFARLSVSHMSAGERDRRSVEFVLSQTSLMQLFDPSMTWPSLRMIGTTQFARLVAHRGGLVAFDSLLRASYRRQRDSLLRETLVRALPTAVLWLAGFVAIAMALLFTRSLFSS